MAQRNDFTCYRGEDLVLTFTMTPTTDISGWTTTFTARTLSPENLSVISGVAGSITSAANGIFTITLSAANTSLTAGQYQYDVVRTDSGFVAVLSIGTMTVFPGVRTP